ncbi:hypothetical protein AB7M32_002542 [Pseudomonas sp. R151218B TE3479]
MLKFASRQYDRHLAVTLAVVAINMFWLLPLAACAVLWNLGGMLTLIIACVRLYCSPSDFMLVSLRRPGLKVKIRALFIGCPTVDDGAAFIRNGLGLGVGRGA